MKLVTFQIDGQIGAGLIVDDQISVCELGESADSALLSLCGREVKDLQAWAKNEIKR